MRLTLLLLGAVLLIGLSSASPARGQWFWGASSDYGFSGPYAGYSAIWAYPVGIGNGPSPYYSPIFNSAAASRPRPNLEPSPYARSPLDLLRFNKPFSGSHAKRFGIFRKR